VIPFYEKTGDQKKLIGVLDIDSPIRDRFSEDDLQGLLGIVG
jgi:putative methionine-R-sulfoxide reductase with GAF domain